MKTVFLEMNSEKVKCNRHKFMEGKFELDIRKTTFSVRSSNTVNKFSKGIKKISSNGESQNLTELGPGKNYFGVVLYFQASPALSGELDQVTYRGDFQIKLFYGSLTNFLLFQSTLLSSTLSLIPCHCHQFFAFFRPVVRMCWCWQWILFLFLLSHPA